ncbi:MAG TPA: hypothetical protein VFB04_16140 [Terriglobales bacterium]|nr:hypothetical protein [Terriglobales bacterium]
MRGLLTLLVLLSPAIVAMPSFAQNGDIVYSNGVLPCAQGGCIDAWPISGGYVTSDTINLTANARVTGFDIWTWEFPMDRVLRIQWSITANENGGTVYASGNTLVNDHGGYLNEYGFDVDQVTLTGLNVNLPAGTYWLNLTNAVTALHDPVYWDENSGYACHSPGCPSQASFTGVGTIPSETFDVRGLYQHEDDQQSKAPKPGTVFVVTSGLLGLGVMIRRRVL